MALQDLEAHEGMLRCYNNDYMRDSWFALNALEQADCATFGFCDTTAAHEIRIIRMQRFEVYMEYANTPIFGRSAGIEVYNHDTHEVEVFVETDMKGLEPTLTAIILLLHLRST